MESGKQLSATCYALSGSRSDSASESGQFGVRLGAEIVLDLERMMGDVRLAEDSYGGAERLNGHSQAGCIMYSGREAALVASTLVLAQLRYEGTKQGCLTPAPPRL